MKKIFLLALAGTLVTIGYLAFWPVPIDPTAWSPPRATGFTGVFAPNKALSDLELLDIGGHRGPEDVVAYEGMIYTTSQSGHILEIDPVSEDVQTIAKLEGPALGIEVDAAGTLIVADAYNGLFAISQSGDIQLMTDRVSAEDPILYADDMDIVPSGAVYFSDASTKFGAKSAGSTLRGSVLEIVEHGRTGRLLKYDPASGVTSVAATGFSFSNGVATGPDGQSIYLAETGEYRILRLWVAGPRAGEQEVVIDNLPGMPDNINRGPDGTFLIGLISTRIPALDNTADSPFWRKVIIRLPDFLKPTPAHYGHIVQIDAEGTVLNSWQDPEGAYHNTTGAIISQGYLYVTSLTEDKLARKKM